MKKQEEFQCCAERLRALADPDRLRIVTCLFLGEKNVGEIASDLGDEIVKISHHLGILRRAGIVQAEKNGRFVQYRLSPEVTMSTDTRTKPKRIDFGCCRVDLSE
jgi:DNA-binding transcriptional ArsR family regulator